MLKREILANQNKDFFRATIKSSNKGGANRLMSIEERRTTLKGNNFWHLKRFQGGTPISTEENNASQF